MSLMGTPTALLISPHGLDHIEQDALNQVLEMLALDGMQFRLHTENVQQAHLVVLDDESEHGKSALLKARTGQVKLVFSSSPRTGKNLISIRKPINLGLLKDILLRVFQKMHEQLAQQVSVSATPDNAQSMDSATLNEVQANTDSLFTRLLQAKEDALLLRITPPALPELYINGRSKSFATRLDQNELKRLFIVPVEQIQVEQIDEASFNDASEGLVISALYRLLWTSGVYGSNGQLLQGHDLHRPVKLRAWPNFTRNDFLPQHLKLAAVLARQPTSIHSLTEQTGIATQDIINFYNAAYATDLIELGSDVTSLQRQPVNKPALDNKRRGIFAKLAARLKLGT